MPQNREEKPHDYAEEDNKALGPNGSLIEEVIDVIWNESESQ